jgi:hypothetical protein
MWWFALISTGTRTEPDAPLYDACVSDLSAGDIVPVPVALSFLLLHRFGDCRRRKVESPEENARTSGTITGCLSLLPLKWQLTSA